MSFSFLAGITGIALGTVIVVTALGQDARYKRCARRLTGIDKTWNTLPDQAKEARRALGEVPSWELTDPALIRLVGREQAPRFRARHPVAR